MPIGALEIAGLILVILILFGPFLIPKLSRRLVELMRATHELKDTIKAEHNGTVDESTEPEQQEDSSD